MTKYFLLYIEWTTVLWKKEFFGEDEASLSACTMKWKEVETEEGGRGGEGKRRRIIRRTGKIFSFQLHSY